MNSGSSSTVSSSSQPPRGWWSRNWKWFVPTGCFSLVLIFVGCIFAFVIVTLVPGSFRNTDVYRQAMAKATSNPEVVAQLGTPIKVSTFLSGSVTSADGSGEANMTIPISGPKGKGNIYLEARKFGGEWTFQRLVVAIDGRQERINLLPGTRELQEPTEQPKPREF
jgi:hypothetical protein